MQHKIVVFDLDETLGYFSKLGKIWQLVDKKNHNQQTFNTILDLFPEFIRPFMITILEYIRAKKMNNTCYKVMIYTNNQSSFENWVYYIQHYFEYKLNYALFDQIIRAFKINGKRVELGRTSTKKSYSDLITCSNLPANIQICFIDDTYHNQMHTSKVVYVKVLQPYIYDLSNEIIRKRLQIKGPISFPYIKKNKKEYEMDKIASKQMMSEIHKFFN